MARTVGRLTALKVERAKKPGMHPDGAGLYLLVSESAAKSWIYRYSFRKKAREMGLGSFPAIGLAEARVKAGECRRKCQEGTDPIEAKKADREHAALEAAKAKAEAAKAITFKDAAAAYITSHSVKWRNSKHAAQWKSTLAAHAEPLGPVSVQAIDTGLVLKVLEPIWTKIPETATRVRQRIEKVLNWAKARNYRTGDNPAQWRGHLDQLLPAPSEVRRAKGKAKHHAALPFDQLPEFMTALRKREGIAARALEFTILCACRTGDIIGNDRDDKPPMRRSHVNFKERVWTIPSTKTDVEHRVPLSAVAMEVLAKMGEGHAEELMFPGMSGEALSNMSMAAVIERMNDDREARGHARYVDPKQGDRDVTVHGMRSTFRTWAGERTNFQREVIEKALAHLVGDETERAYDRGDLFDKRRRLMDEWAKYCNTAKPAARSDKVVALRSASK